MASDQTTDLDRIIEIAKKHVMTPRERREQRISFVWGMLPSTSTLTKKDVRRIMEEQGL